MTCIPPHSFPRKLRWLILTGNEIEEIPAEVGQCHGLQKCMLSGNRLSGLPDAMRNCRKLALLRLSSNLLEEVPEWLLEMPELAFLSFAGNPCVVSEEEEEVEENVGLDHVPWHEVEVQHLLGEGASGIISKGVWRTGTGEGKEVAVKVFKGAITSDGSPVDEMTATLTAGQHPNLINPLGKIHSHPDDKKGLVLQLIPPHYTNLGGPPSLDTCTRDNFPPGTTLSLGQVKSILLGIASAASHLHERGIIHGDLYAHNILTSPSGHALLGDFGAATVYGTNKKHGMQENLERLDVLGFAHLVEDLLGLVVRDVHQDSAGGEGEIGVLDEKEGTLIEELNRLHWRCSDPVVGRRPGFQEVRDVLEGL